MHQSAELNKLTARINHTRLRFKRGSGAYLHSAIGKKNALKIHITFSRFSSNKSLPWISFVHNFGLFSLAPLHITFKCYFNVGEP